MQSRSQRRRRILKQCIQKKSKIEDNAHVTQEIDSEYEDVSEMEEDEHIQYEDEFDDEYESEEGEINIDSEDEEILEKEEQSQEQSQQTQQQQQPIQQQSKLKRKKKGMEQENQENQKRVWFYDEAENLDFDNRAYNMLHRVTTEWPCLSCDFVLTEEEQQQYKNKEYQKMNKYPYSVYLAAGTQAAQPTKNQIYLLKLSKMHKTKYDDDEASQSEEDSEDDNLSNDEEGQVHLSSVTGLKCGVNRIKTMNGQAIAAYWNENGDVNILDLNPLYKKLQSNQQSQFNLSQLHHKVFKNQHEGFALDWSRLKVGDLLSGSVDGKIYLYQLNNNDWIRENKAYEYHKGSVEDLQFSPIESFVFASCSTDGTLCIVDTREGKHKQAQILVKAHNCDVNVISWNQVSATLVATGADDGCFKIWDLKYPKNDAISEIQFHNKAITSIQFQPNSDSSIAVSSEDHKLSIWDFAVENENNNEDDVPDQLMFVHQGQKDLKELKYHPVYYEMIVSTSANGFNVFKPTLDEEEKKSEQSEEDQDQIPVIKEEDLNKYFQQMSIQ
ncbi:unnamed protein product [Paramecium primaurelia]|uniref:Histone-binding protein RBBP4-like N-terminal domain-containing protein n=1 Tax=Paramecium primaurelia TaxID=5886 RepID=A0A8S1QDG4_PARPR|nr:unnamed protein product [Paramecium primaurelia]